jgi:hypothetical protein
MVERASPVKGLATIAMLKARYDKGQDHIDMFQPFLDDAIRSAPTDELKLEEVRTRIETQHGLRVPLGTLSVLLTRAKRRGVVRSDGGRFFRIAAGKDVDSISRARAQIEREHSVLARAFSDFSVAAGLPVVVEDKALHLLLTFLSTNHIELLLDDRPPAQAAEAPGLTRKESRFIARFIETVCLRDPNLHDYLTRILEGYVLQNALLLHDIAAAKRQFKELRAFFDSGFLFSALGLKGTPTQQAAAESLSIMRAVGIRTRVFDKTIDEMKRILAVYEHKLGTAKGREELWPTDLTRFFLTNKYQPSDVREVIALLAQQLGQLGVVEVPLPKHDRRYTLDEEALAAKIKYPTAVDINERVLHDVDCIAGVLTTRADSNPQSWEDARAVFVAISALLVRNTSEWYQESGGVGLPPIIHALALTNLAWLKKPAAAQTLRQHQLVALCEAALRPSKELWQKFLAHLRKLESDGRVTSDEAVAVLASELTDRLLSQIEDDEHVEAASLVEIVDRVKAEYQKAANEQVAAAKAEAADAVEKHRRLVIRLTARGDTLASGLAWGLILLLGAVAGYGLLRSVPGLVSTHFPSARARVVAGASTWAFLLLTFLSLWSGAHLKRWRRSLSLRLRPYCRRLTLGESAD